MEKSEKDKISNKKRAFINRGAAIFLLRLGLGGLFIYASLYKIRNTVKFKNTISDYELLPYWLINITAIILPWLEFWIGVFLILGIFVRSCAIMQGKLLLVFILVIVFSTMRGLEFSCGCFAHDSTINGMNYFHIILDAFLLLMAIILFIIERRRFSHRFLGSQNTN